MSGRLGGPHRQPRPDLLRGPRQPDHHLAAAHGAARPADPAEVQLRPADGAAEPQVSRGSRGAVPAGPEYPDKHVPVSFCRYQSIRRTITNDSRPEEQPPNETPPDETDLHPSIPGIHRHAGILVVLAEGFI